MASETPDAHEASCIFCRIVRGEAQASVAYEDDRAVAFMDIQPLSRGHLLVVPRLHAADLFALPDPLAAHLFVVTRRLALALRESHHPDGINVVQSNGRAAGQVVFHLHIHVIPRSLEGGGPRLGWHRMSPAPTRAELEEDAARIRAAARNLPPSRFR
ncbi:HIT family protein [Limnochorda pilosa]|uniref:Protein hit n=1 Tax=Limnochorda pilosa TaxID=1555112 RepID=A0A0K2SKD5_LIMPI|nr:HIT family protein [Limnochorda pilosa]BAS27578.1 protein hit [Limnochorda pilosa]